ncbi:MAG: protein-L-isoaspartate(D-aspartate) O-methyltransferase [Cyclobacteriaceae bacterium]|nr:protein-L-isoaspartate(D-aspartate) O-methyltransferase [Cyclobacteriaceae bacterium]UYN88485.1 MAG: protein-L-isoaspartate(D-aspartate) O-methyltransferase [Cyclobacteriaceae bacterium]
MLAGLFFLTECTAYAQDFNVLRNKMVKEQLTDRGIKSTTVLDAMNKVERHRFVPVDLMKEAYNDYPLPIGEGQTISQPYIVAFMTEALNLKPTDRVLEIGTGSGYQAAILGEIVKEVYSIEIVEVLGLRAKNLLHELGYANIQVRIGDGYQGWPEASPSDAIIVTCSPKKIPEPLQAQLAEGGRMIIPVGEDYKQELVLITKEKGKLKQKSRLRVMFVPMKDGGGRRY